MSLWGQPTSEVDEDLRFSEFTSINWNTQRTGFANGGNMDFRFRKSIKILPGLKINLTHKGISSASIGKPGASLNIGKKAPEPAWAFPEQDFLIPSIIPIQTGRIPHRIPLSNHLHWITQVCRHPDQLSGSGSRLGCCVLLLEQSFFRGFTMMFDFYHGIIWNVSSRPEETLKLMLSTILVRCSTYF